MKTQTEINLNREKKTADTMNCVCVSWLVKLKCDDRTLTAVRNGCNGNNKTAKNRSKTHHNRKYHILLWLKIGYWLNCVCLLHFNLLFATFVFVSVRMNACTVFINGIEFTKFSRVPKRIEKLVILYRKHHPLIVVD